MVETISGGIIFVVSLIGIVQLSKKFKFKSEGFGSGEYFFYGLALAVAVILFFLSIYWLYNSFAK